MRRGKIRNHIQLTYPTEPPAVPQEFVNEIQNGTFSVASKKISISVDMVMFNVINQAPLISTRL
jgi:hypothetical protein